MSLTDERLEPAACETCGRAMRADIAQMPMWLGSELKLIDGVPVQVCEDCDTQQYQPQVEAAIRKLAAEGFPARKVRRQVLVSVFDLSDFLGAAGPQSLEVAAE